MEENFEMKVNILENYLTQLKLVDSLSSVLGRNDCQQI